MNWKLASLAIIMVILCSITPSVFAKAQTNHSRETSNLNKTYTVTNNLPSGYLYTQVKLTVTITGPLTSMYHTVIDTKGNTHIWLKFFGESNTQAEFLFWDPVLQEWVLGQQISSQTKILTAVSELIFTSGTQTQKEIQVFKERYSLNGISPMTGEPITQQDYLLIERLIVKVIDGEVQFEKTLEITHNY